MANSKWFPFRKKQTTVDVVMHSSLKKTLPKNEALANSPSLYKNFPLDVPAYQTFLADRTLEEVTALSVFRWNSIPLEEAFTFAEAVMVYAWWRAAKPEIHPTHKRLEKLLEGEENQNIPYLAQFARNRYHVWDLLQNFYELPKRPVPMEDFAKTFFVPDQWLTEEAGMDVLVEQELLKVPPATAMVRLTTLAREGYKSPTWALQKYLADPAFEDLPLSWWIMAHGYGDEAGYSFHR